MTILPGGVFPSLTTGTVGDMTVSPVGSSSSSSSSSSSLRCGDAKKGPGGFFGGHVGGGFTTAL
eukprot:6460001-Amphidinium_carterae.1